MATETDRQALIEAIRKDDDKRPASAVLVAVDGESELLVCWHGTRDNRDAYDVYVFQEAFRGDKLQPWQEQILLSDACKYPLGNRRNTLKKTWAVCYDRALSDAELQALARRFVG
jgi:hypothetical protein